MTEHVSEIRLEVHWCPECGADHIAEIIQLAADPEPVALCTECGAGLALWLAAEAGQGRATGTRGAA